MEHIIKVTGTINKTLKKIESKRYGEEVYSAKWYALTDEIGILCRVREHLEAKKKIAAEYSKKFEELKRQCCSYRFA